PVPGTTTVTILPGAVETQPTPPAKPR
ncbi:hypothetical protein C7477_12633, partial [Phyllobacterium leguminum]